MFMPMTRIGLPIQQVLSPAYSRIQDDDVRLERAWLASKRVSNALLAPAFLGTLVAAPDVVHVVFGSKWDEAIRPLQLLCVAGAAHASVQLHWSILQARGKAGSLLRVVVLVAIVTVGSFAAGLPWGITGVAASYAIAKWALVLPDTWITTRAVGFDFWRGLASSIAVVPLAAVAAAATFGFRLLLVHAGVPPAARLPLLAIEMVAAYVGLILNIAPSVLDDAKKAFRSRRAA
jgi:PST family polysaccharide transporter